MFAALPALSPRVVSPSLPRATPQPLRRVAGGVLAAVTVLALLAASAVPARADRLTDATLAQLTPPVVEAILHPLNQAPVTLAPLSQAPVSPLAVVHSPKPQSRPPVAVTPPVEVRSPRVPAVCAVEVSGARRNLTVYPERCLRREGFEFRLPRYCAYEARVFGRMDRVYTESCLRDAGFRVDNRGFRDHGRGHGRGNGWNNGWDNGRGHGWDHGPGRPRHSY